MPGEAENSRASGRLLMKAGIKLLPAYAGSGYNERTRFFTDGSSRMYFMEAIEMDEKDEESIAEAKAEDALVKKELASVKEECQESAKEGEVEGENGDVI